MTTRTATPAGSKRSWPVPAALIALVTIPVIAGVLRLVQLSGGAATMPANPRFDASPLPVVVHIVSAIVFALVGAFQFVPRLRRAGGRGTAEPGASWWSPGWAWRCPRCGSTSSSRGRTPPATSCTRCGGCSEWRWWSPSSSGSVRFAGATSPVIGCG